MRLDSISTAGTEASGTSNSPYKVQKEVKSDSADALVQ